MAVPVANLKIKLDGEAEYRAALSSIDKSFKELGSEMNLLSAKFSKNGDSMEALSAKSEVLSKKVETQPQKGRRRGAVDSGEGTKDLRRDGQHTRRRKQRV